MEFLEFRLQALQEGIARFFKTRKELEAYIQSEYNRHYGRRSCEIPN